MHGYPGDLGASGNYRQCRWASDRAGSPDCGGRLSLSVRWMIGQQVEQGFPDAGQDLCLAYAFRGQLGFGDGLNFGMESWC